MAYAQNKTRDVEYTKQLSNFINLYYNNKISSDSQAQNLFQTSLDSVPQDFDEYQKQVHLARCNYFYGMYVMGEYDFSGIQNIKSINDKDNESQNLESETKAKKELAATYFDKAISYAEKALAIHAGSDAYLIMAMSISSNCTVKKTSYVIGNGLKVASLSKKALALDAKNASACYYQYAQDLYAPEFFANYKRGYQKMYDFLNNSELTFETFDRFNFMTAIGYSFYKRKDFKTAIEWYQKALEIYPQNSSVQKMLKTLSN